MKNAARFFQLKLRIDGNDPRLVASFSGDVLKFEKSGLEVWRGLTFTGLKFEVTGLDKIFGGLLRSRKRIKSKKFEKLFDLASDLKVRDFGELVDLIDALAAGNKLTGSSGTTARSELAKTSSDEAGVGLDDQFAIDLEPEDDDDDADANVIEDDNFYSEDPLVSEARFVATTNLQYMKKLKQLDTLTGFEKAFVDSLNLELLTDLVAMTDPAWRGTPADKLLNLEIHPELLSILKLFFGNATLCFLKFRLVCALALSPTRAV